MRPAQHGFGIVAGILVAAGTLCATETICCVPAHLMDPTLPNKCTGLSVTSCDRTPTTSTSGLTFSGNLRLAKCFSYASSTTVVQRACVLGQPPTGGPWTKVPGEVSTGVCCWIEDPATIITNQTFQIEPCATQACPQ